MSDERWAWLREQTPVLKQYAYMNTGWSGPLSVPVVQAMERRLRLEMELGPTTRPVMEDRMEAGGRLRDLAARMFGAESEEIAVTGNTTEGLNIFINGLDIGAGDGVITTSVEHGSGIVPAYYLRERRGAELQIVELAADDAPGVIAERMAAAMTERTRLVILSEISYSTGQLLPLSEIVEAAHRVGAVVLVDGAQTAGHLPLDVHASGVDGYAVPSHKWLCGPDGLGMLYVRGDLIPDIWPAKMGGRAAASYDLEGNFEPRVDEVTKFEVSTVSGALIAGTVVALEQYLESGPQAVFDRVRELTRYAEQRIGGLDGVTLTGPDSDRARTGLFCFAVDGERSGRVSAYLQREAAVVCRAVQQFNSIRLSLHVFNTEQEIDGVAQAVERAVAEGIPEDVATAVAAETRAAERT